jgi:hypothetical protein
MACRRSSLSLPDVTLIAIDTVAHELTRLALEECVRRVDFAEVLVFTDRPDFSVPGVSIPYVVLTDPLRDWETVNSIWWYKVPALVLTSHFLTVQWDSWILNAAAWDPDWLQYDYIGAPWPWHQIYRVGNGGFSLRSQKLHAHLRNNRLRYPLAHPEDDALCRRYRPMLEAEGFRWAPESVAHRFAFEHGPAGPTFGYHGCFRWPDVLSDDGWRARLPLANDYVRSTPGWAQMLCRSATP